MQSKTITKIAVILLAGWSSAAWAQSHDISVGAHAGANWYLTDGGLTNSPGGGGGVDLSYALRGELTAYTQLGAKIGAGISYASCHQSKLNYKEQYINIDYDSWYLQYTISANSVTEWQRQFQLEVPLMVSLLTHGVTINVGAKYMMPFYQNRQIDVMGSRFDVYMRKPDITISDYKAFGRFDDHQYHGAKEPARMAQHNILAALEIGYEFSLDRHSRLGVQGYCDFGVWNNYTNHPSRQRLIDVEPIMNKSYPVPDIHVNALTDTYSTAARYVSCGVKLYYTFHTGKQNKYPCHCVMDE